MPIVSSSVRSGSHRFFHSWKLVSVLTMIVFSASLIFFAAPVEAVQYCLDNELIKGSRPEKGATGFLIGGCGSVIHDGEEISCYHSLSGIVQTVLSAYHLLLSVVGSLALLMFVWGGFQWLIAGGTEKRIQAGMTTLKNAVIGLLIVFGAWVGVNLIVVTLTGGSGKLAFQSAGEQWYQIHKDALCYRAMSSSELAKALAAPAKIITPPPPTVPSGTACRGTIANAKACKSDCECVSGNCYNGFCGGGGLDISEVMGGCCGVKVDGGKVARRMKLERCKQFLQEEFNATPVRIKNTPAYFCPFPTNRVGATEQEVCWSKPFSAGDYTIGKECETVKEPIAL
ncbi:hypothetical protein HY621_01485 [Candidatus Uhrbacteria bacterium]|nr:hypothetical protein [Candidatus Uhrbacteria bacterium]